MISEAVIFAFTKIDLTMITLAVYDFNRTAIACYKKLGFREYEFQKNASRFGDEYWGVSMMKLGRKDWENFQRNQ